MMIRTSLGGRVRHAGGLGVALLFVPVLAVVTLAAGGGEASLSAARSATAGLHDLDQANAAGYSVEVADLAGITCIESAAGTMGVHYLNPSLIPELVDPAFTGTPSVDAATPELLVFEPGANGQMRLVALEYLTIKASWDATHASPPALFGRTFDTTPAGNRYGLPDFYSLHAWIWNPNPAGLFAPYSRKVSCP
jgi:hypothetical protein